MLWSDVEWKVSLLYTRSELLKLGSGISEFVGVGGVLYPHMLIVKSGSFTYYHDLGKVVL